MKNSLKHIKQIAAINQIIEIRKYGIKEDYASALKINGVHSLIKQIKSKTGLDLLSINSPQDYLYYEEYLKKILYKELSSDKDASQLDEEIKFLNNCSPFSVSTFSSYDISLGDSWQGSELYNLLISNEELISILKKPEAVESISNEDFAGFDLNLLVLSKFDLKSEPVYVLAHLVKDDKSNMTYIKSCFYYRYLNLATISPSRMLLKAINKYGTTMIVGDKIGKFIFTASASVLSFNSKPNMVLLPNAGRHLFQSFIQHISRQYGVSYFMCYTIKASVLKEDLLKSRLVQV